MRIYVALIGLSLVAAMGCTNPPPAPMAVGPTTELTTLKLPFEESFPDAEGAKRVVVCQLKDQRTQTGYVGEGLVRGDRAAVSKYVMRDDPTLVLPRILAKNLKQAGFNVSLGDRMTDVVGSEAIREALKRNNGDYLIAGRLEELYIRGRSDAGQPVFVTVVLRFDIYNNDGQLKMYYPARFSDAEFLGEKAGDAEEMSAFLDRSVNALFARTFEDAYFLKALDLEPEAVKELMKAKPAPEAKPAEEKPAETKPAEEKPAETKPAETKPAEEKPAETKPEEKPAEPKKETTDADKKKLDTTRDLENAVKDSARP